MEVLGIQVNINQQIMKYLIGIFAIVLFLSSCHSKKIVIDEKVSTPEQSVLNENDQRKFDYYFYEALRERLSGNYDKAGMFFTECLKIDPSSSVALYEVAKLFIMQQDFIKAELLLENAVKYNNGNIWYKQMLGDIYQQNNKGLNAVGIYEDIVDKNPDDERYLYVLSMLYKENGLYEKAIRTLDRLQDKIGLIDVLAVEKQQLYLQLGKNRQAFNELQQLINKFPYDSKVYAFAGDHFLQLKDLSKAGQYYQLAVDKDESGSVFNFNLGNVALLKGDTILFKTHYTIALESSTIACDIKINKIVPLLMDRDFSSQNKFIISYFIDVLKKHHEDDGECHSFLARYYASIEDKDQSLVYFKKAIDNQVFNESLWHDALLLIVEKQDFNDLANYGEKAVSFFPANPFFKLLYAAALQQLKQEVVAISVLLEAEKLVDKNNIPMLVQILSSLGDNYYAVGQSKPAFEAYERALKLDANSIVVLNNYAYYLSLEKKDLDKAERMSQKCIELEPSNSTYLDTHAWVLFQRGRFFEAKFIIERAMDYNGSQSAVIVEHYGDILYFNNDLDGAILQWKKALELNSDSKTIMKKIEKKQYFENESER